ncbi:MAG: SIS domain-containing protein [Candidatus Binatia bacterium]|nr:SIS domain-containing protein [Candidatus Binatia bacterium]
MDMKELITAIFADSIAAKHTFLQEQLDVLIRAIEEIARALTAGGKILLFGNGGSAADAQHIAAEFVNRYLMERAPLPAIALTTDTSVLTAIVNDYGPADLFAKQIRALGKAGDVAIAISTSGNSVNVLKGIEACRDLGIRTIGLTGGRGGAMAGMVDYLLCVSATSTTPRIQETHLLIGHVICEMVEHLLSRHSVSCSVAGGERHGKATGS